MDKSGSPQDKVLIKVHRVLSHSILVLQRVVLDKLKIMLYQVIHNVLVMIIGRHRSIRMHVKVLFVVH